MKEETKTQSGGYKIPTPEDILKIVIQMGLEAFIKECIYKELKLIENMTNKNMEQIVEKYRESAEREKEQIRIGQKNLEAQIKHHREIEDGVKVIAKLLERLDGKI